MASDAYSSILLTDFRCASSALRLVSSLSAWYRSLRSAKSVAPDRCADYPGLKELFLRSIHSCTKAFFMALVERGLVRLQPGVARLVDAAVEARVEVAVFSTLNELEVPNVVEIIGAGAARKIEIFEGDVVYRKKPAPDL